MVTVEEDILFYAFRYALGRRTYAAGTVVDNILFLIPVKYNANKNYYFSSLNT